MPGIIELLAILLSLGDFGAAANPKAPSANEIMKYAPADYDFMFYADVEVVIPKNYNALKDLKNKPEVKRSAKLLEAHRELMREVETALSMAQSTMNFDPIKDIKSVAIWVKVKQPIPEVLAVVRGKLPVEGIKGMLSMGGAPFSAGEGAKGELIVGTPAWVDARIKDKKWKPEKANPNALALLKQKPIFAMVSTIGDDTAKLMAKEFHGADNVLTDVISGHSFAGMYVTHNGAGWTWVAKDKDGYKRAVTASEGIIQLLRSGHLATRGIAQVIYASVDSYKGLDKDLDVLIDNKDKIMKVVMGITGDGKFKANVRKQANKKTLVVQLSGRRLSEVLPLGGVFGLGGIGAFLVMGRDSSRREMTAEAKAPAAVEAVPPAPKSTKRLRVRDTYRAARSRHGM